MQIKGSYITSKEMSQRAYFATSSNFVSASSYQNVACLKRDFFPPMPPEFFKKVSSPLPK